MKRKFKNLGQGKGRVITDAAGTVLSISVEKEEGVLQDSPVFKQLVPNSYSGALSPSLTKLSPNELDPRKQQTKGTVTQRASTPGFETDFKNDRLKQFLPGLFNGDYVDERGSTDRYAPANNDATVASVAADGYVTTNTTSANGWSVPSNSTLLLIARGFTNPANNGFKIATSVTGTKVLVAGLTAETAPATASLTIVGVGSAASGSIAYAASSKTLTFIQDISFLDIKRGEWIQYVNAGKLVGYGRVASSAAKSLVLDVMTWTGADISASETGQVIVASRYIHNPDTDDLKEITYQAELKLNDNNYQVATGMRANTLALGVSTAAIMTAQLDFVGKRTETNSTAKTATRIGEKKETIYNTSRDVKAVVIYNQDNEKVVGTIQEATLNINNNLAPQYGVGTDENVGTISGKFTLTLGGTAYFTSLDLNRTAEDNITVGAYIIVRNESGGFIIDIPELTMENPEVGVALDSAITVSLDSASFISDRGYTARWHTFEYLKEGDTSE